MNSPSDLIRARIRAFAAGDFGFIYDSYHPEARFRQMFPEREAYEAYGREVLSGDYRIREWRILKEEVGEGEARTLSYLEISFRERCVASFELSRFRRSPQGWRYWSALKLEREEFAGRIEEIGWEDFANSVEF